MTIKDFFNLILKLFALYSLVGLIFNVIPTYYSFLIYDAYQEDYSGAAYAAGAVALLVGLFFYLAYRADWIVSKLKLDRGFESNHIPFEKIDALTIVKIGCIIIGGLIFLENFPYFLMRIYAVFRIEADSGSLYDSLSHFLGASERDHTARLTINSLNLIISYLLLTNYSFVARKLVNRDSPPTRE